MVSRLLLEYDGSRFSGWARQLGARTVQEEIERALAVVLRLSDVRLTVAGRTDAGVHAWGQVASYSGPPAAVASLNALLPDDVAVSSCSEASPGFDARRDATSRAYCYRVLVSPGRSPLLRGRVLNWPHSVDVGLLEGCAAALSGTHDFTAFTPTESEHLRFERDVCAAFWVAGSGRGFGALPGSAGVGRGPGGSAGVGRGPGVGRGSGALPVSGGVGRGEGAGARCSSSGSRPTRSCGT